MELDGLLDYWIPALYTSIVRNAMVVILTIKLAHILYLFIVVDHVSNGADVKDNEGPEQLPVCLASIARRRIFEIEIDFAVCWIFFPRNCAPRLPLFEGYFFGQSRCRCFQSLPDRMHLSSAPVLWQKSQESARLTYNLARDVWLTARHVVFLALAIYSRDSNLPHDWLTCRRVLAVRQRCPFARANQTIAEHVYSEGKWGQPPPTSVEGVDR